MTVGVYSVGDALELVTREAVLTFIVSIYSDLMALCSQMYRLSGAVVMGESSLGGRAGRTDSSQMLDCPSVFPSRVEASSSVGFFQLLLPELWDKINLYSLNLTWHQIFINNNNNNKMH